MAAKAPDGQAIDLAENRRRMASGELYYAFTPDLITQRKRCAAACARFNTAGDMSRRKLVELWHDIAGDTTQLPPEAETGEEDEAQLADYAWVESPVKMDYGYNVKLGKNVFVNFNSVWIDTCEIRVGARTLIGPNCCFYSGTHPLDPFVRNGTSGPEAGKPITVGEDCWLGGNVIVLPGVTIGRGVTVGAGSVVTKDVPDFVCVVGNPARILKKVETSGGGRHSSGADVLAGEAAIEAGAGPAADI